MLDHARFIVTEAGAIIEAVLGRFEINGRAIEDVKLAVGDRIEAGFYFLQVEALSAGLSLVLTVTLTVLLEVLGDGGRRWSLRLLKLFKRWLSYFAFGGVLLFFFLVLISFDLLQNTVLSVIGSKSEMLENVI